MNAQQFSLSHIEEDVLASLVRRQQKYLSDTLVAIESRDGSLHEVLETISLVEQNLKKARTYIQRSSPGVF